MIFGVEICLRELLFEQECVILPNFGGFLTKYKSAEIDHLASLIHPPRKTLSFNRQLKNDDGLLINTYRALNQVSFSEAATTVKKWIVDFENRLKEQGSAEIPKIGTFFWDKYNNTLSFEFDETQNYLAEAYGLPAVNVAAVQRNPVVTPVVKPQKETTEAVAVVAPVKTINTPKPKQNTEEKKRNYKQAIFITAVAILTLVFSFPAIKIHTSDLKLNEAGIFTIFSKWFETEKVSENVAVLDNVPESPQILENNTETEIIEVNSDITASKKEEIVQDFPAIEESKYQIVLGAFRIAENADNYVAQIKSEHADFNVKQYKFGARNYVVIPAGNSEDKARHLLEKTRMAYDCWLKTM